MTIISNDRQDARFHKRLRTFSDAGFAVRWLAYNRNRALGFTDDILTAIPGQELAQTFDRRYAQRVAAMALGLGRLFNDTYLDGNVDVVYCINLDNLLLAILARRLRHLTFKIVYEVADIQPVLLRADAIGKALRAVERWCLTRIDLLVYTSGAYMDHFLKTEQGYGGPSLLLENKVYPAPPVLKAPKDESDGRIVLGFFGQLKCRRSLDLIRALAQTLPDRVHFLLRGYPNGLLENEFAELLRNARHVTYGGPYRYPADLPELYNSIDLCWGFDFCSPGANSEWTLANRLYEAGYFGVPILVEEGTAGGDYVAKYDSGWALSRGVDQALSSFLQKITKDEIAGKRAHLANLGRAPFALDGDLSGIRSAFYRMFDGPACTGA